MGFSFSISILRSRKGTANLPLQVFSSSYQLSRKGDSGTILKERVTPASKSTWKCSLASACGPRRCDSAAPQWSPRSGQVLSEDKVEALSVPVSPRVPGLSSPRLFYLGLVGNWIPSLRGRQGTGEALTAWAARLPARSGVRWWPARGAPGLFLGGGGGVAAQPLSRTSLPPARRLGSFRAARAPRDSPRTPGPAALDVGGVFATKPPGELGADS